MILAGREVSSSRQRMVAVSPMAGGAVGDVAAGADAADGAADSAGVDAVASMVVVAGLTD